jgi:hypothetical protein
MYPYLYAAVLAASFVCALRVLLRSRSSADVAGNGLVVRRGTMTKVGLFAAASMMATLGLAIWSVYPA